MRKTIAAALAATLAMTAAPTFADKHAKGEKGRDWNQIDTNKDGYIQPEEMEKWLAANPGPLKK